MQLTLSIAFKQVPTTAAVMKILKFYCNNVLLLSTALLLVDLFVAIMQVTVSIAIVQLKVSAAFMQVKVSAANMWMTIFY